VKRPKQRRRRSEVEQAASARWHVEVLAKWPMRGSGWQAGLEAHHVVFAQVLRRRAKQLGLDETEIVWDPRGGMPLKLARHRRFHAGLEVITRRELPRESIVFANELGLEWWIERRYAAA
jgi:hypothetical protein